MTAISRIVRSRSEHLHARAMRLMPGGVSSPVRAFKAVGGRPLFIERAEGACIFDADGHRYIDLVGSWGAAIVGHAHPRIVEAVRIAAAKGLGFGACCAAEADLAEAILRAFPPGHLDMVRFVNSGTEATMSAIRLARAATARVKIVKFHGNYHGHADPFLVSAGSGAAAFGTPDSPGVTPGTAAATLPARFNDLRAVDEIMARHGHDVAAIIVEPLAGNMGFITAEEGFLGGLRRLCDRHKSLLIFDEVMTGFRVALGGFQNLCNVRPDLTCLGKVIGGGLPVAAYAGRRSLMERLSPLGPVYQAGTLSGNPLGMAAGLETLRLCAQPRFYERLAEISRKLTEGFAHAAADAGRPLSAGYVGGLFGIAFSEHPPRNFDDAKACDHVAYARFFHAMLDRGVWLPPSSYEAMFVSAAHTDEHIQATIAAARESFGEIA